MTQCFPLADAQVQMTLAALAYAADTDPKTHTIPPIADVKKEICKQLASGKYATGTDWSLVWGPIQTEGTDNLVYIAKRTNGDLAVCLRGTTTQWYSRREDLPTGQRRFPTANTKGETVSTEFFGGLVEMLACHDPDQHSGIMQFVATNLAPGATVYVNGHSQGAALVPMMMAALQLGWAGHPRIAAPIKGFAFAPPTSGNPAFASWVDSALDCWFVINPLDVVPLGYASINDVLTKQIPGPLPDWPESWGIEAAVEFARGVAYETGPWAQPSQQAILQHMPLHQLEFFSQVIGQHNHNSYLYMLGAAIIDQIVPDPTPMAGTTVPQPPVTNVPVC